MTELEEIIAKIKEDLPYFADKYKVKSLGIFGSYVRDEQKKRSDLDVLVEFTEPIGLLEYVALERELGERTGKKVDLVMKTALKPRIGKHILAEVRYLQTTKDYRDYLDDIINAIGDVEDFTKDMTYEEFRNGRKTLLAVFLCITDIGEAAKRIPSSFRSKYRNVPWKEMAGMRDKLTHEYDQIDTTIVWKTVEQNLPQLKIMISDIIMELGNEEQPCGTCRLACLFYCIGNYIFSFQIQFSKRLVVFGRA